MTGRSHRNWRSRSVILPIALSVAATATAIGLWLWLDDSQDSHHHSHSQKHDPSDSEHDSDAGAYSSGKRRVPHIHGHDGRKSSRIPPGASPSSSSGTIGLIDNTGSGSAGKPLSRVDEESEPNSIRSSGGRRKAPTQSIPQGIASPPAGGTGAKVYSPPPKTRTVALVVSAAGAGSPGSQAQSTTLLTSLPQPLTIPSNTTLHILIYTPSLTPPTLNPTTHTSFPTSPTGTAYQPQPPSKIHEIAYGILPISYPKEYILPYTTHPTGTSSLLRHLSPEIVYMEETLAGDRGQVLGELIGKGWIREGIVVLGTGPGAIGGGGNGLVDSSDEEGIEKIGYNEAGLEGKGKEKDANGEGKKGKRWWEEQGWDGGRGGGSVIDRTFLADDWNRRVWERK